MRHSFGESEDDYDLDMEKRTSGVGGRSGRIILLGDGTEVLTDSDETEMFDHEEEDEDLDSQVSKSVIKAVDEDRAAREETPGPEPQISADRTYAESNAHPDREMITDKIPSTETASPLSKSIPESVIPEKLHNPPTSQPKQ